MIIGQFLSENCSIRLKFPNLPISGRNTIFEGYNNVLWTDKKFILFKVF